LLVVGVDLLFIRFRFNMNSKGISVQKQLTTGGTKISTTKTSTIASIVKTLNLIQDASRSATFLLKLITSKRGDHPTKRIAKLNAIQKFVVEWKEYLSVFTVIFEYLLVMLKKNDVTVFSQEQMKTLLSITKNMRFSLKNSDTSMTFVILGNIVFRHFLQNSVLLPFSNVIWISLASFLHSQFEVLYPQLTQSSRILTGFLRDSADSLKEGLKSQLNTKMEELKETNPDLYDKIQTQLNKLEMATYLPGILSTTIVKYTKKQSKKYMPIVNLILENAISSSFETFQTTKFLAKEFLSGNIPLSVILNQDWAKIFTKNLNKYLLNSNVKKQTRSKL